ncbi:uncharacterized protein RCC_06976 [Ramularia collo-cygni]|uniref:Uncharacterized protein n=1 Tax=Ramularia collo-cygni TaxID=112498 RepID=A0A2D3V342_9PEZI|nr:uncharacterized protein RCC_06976 [Ramularia collo-cygni]CZT21115.1 uncharacterized protein RCC_06976 [Ramularia collo-cygni]
MKPTTSLLITPLLLLTLASAQQQQQQKRPCTQAEIALATGIHLNIQAQHAEYNGTQKIIDIETQNPGDFYNFARLKGQLQANIQSGINLRQFNLQIAPEGNPAIPGLKKYQEAQATEKGQVDGLCGVYVEDRETLERLMEEVKGGILLNEGNLKNATSVCDFTLVFPPANEMGV